MFLITENQDLDQHQDLQKGDDRGLALGLEGHVIVALVPDPGIGADTLLDLGHRKGVNEKKSENAGQKAFLKSNQKL